MDDDLIEYVNFSNEEFATENSIYVESQCKYLKLYTYIYIFIQTLYILLLQIYVYS